MIHTCYSDVWSWFYIIHGNKTNKRLSYHSISQSPLIMEIYAPQMPRFPVQENSRPICRDFWTNHHPLPMTWMPRPCTSQVPTQNKTLHPNRKKASSASSVMAFKVLTSWLQEGSALLTCWDSSFLYSKWFPVHWHSVQMVSKKTTKTQNWNRLYPNKIDYMGENGWYISDSCGAMSPRKIIS